MSDFVYNAPEYPEDFFEEDGLYMVGGRLHHVLAVADTMFGRLAWATMDRHGKVDIQTLTPSMFKDAIPVQE